MAMTEEQETKEERAALHATKAAKDDKKRLKHQLEVQLRRAQNANAYWQITLEQTDLIIRTIDQRVAALAARKSRLLQELAIAPERRASATKEIRRLAAILHQPEDLSMKVARALKLAMQLEHVKSQLAECDLTPEQLQVLSQSVAKTKIGGNE